jgi:hypothetical protein
MVATAMSVTLRPPEGAREPMNPSIRITYLLMRLLAFSIVATAMFVTLRPPEGAKEPMIPSMIADLLMRLLAFSMVDHTDVCDFEAAREGQGAHEPFYDS